MAIKLKYGAPGSILQTGFAAGVGQSKKKQQEDALQLVQQNAQQAFQGQQAGFNRLLQVGLQQQNQAAQFEMQGRAFRNQDMQNQANRFFQAGQAELDRDFRGEMADKALGERRLADERRFAEETFFRLPPIPEHVDPDVRKDLAKSRSAMGTLLGKGWDRSGPATKKAWDEAYDAYTTGIAALPPPDRAAEANKSTIYRDKTGKAFNEPDEGRAAFDSRTNRPIENPQAEALAQQQMAQQKQQEAIRAQQEKQQQALEADAKQIYKTKSAEDPTYTIDQAIKEAQGIQAKFDALRPQPQQAAAAPPTITDQQGLELQPMQPGFWNQQTPAAPQQAQQAAPIPGGGHHLTPDAPMRQTTLKDYAQKGGAAGEPEKPVALDDLSPDDRKMAQMWLPQPKTPEDAMKLPVGTRYLRPDGTVWTKGQEQ